MASPRAIADRVAGWAVCLLPGGLTAYYAFNGGGHGADVRGVALLLLSLLLAGRVALVRRPFDGISPPLMIAGGALVLLAAWTWLSGEWSDAPIRATTEFQRAALYAVTLIFFGSFLRRHGGLALAVRGVALAVAAVCVVALATRLYPDHYTVGSGFSGARLGYPLEYWNGLGLLAGVGLVLMLHLASDLREHWSVRALAAGAVPIAATTVYFTFSRGATAATVGGVLVYLALGRPRGLVATFLATAPTTFLALHSAWGADLLGTERNTTEAAAAQGHRVAGALLLCSAAAVIARLALTYLDTRMSRVTVPLRTRGTLAVAAAMIALAGVVVAIAADAPARAGDAWDSFTQKEQGGDARTRFRSVTLSGRQDHWDVALSNYRDDKLKGAGAGTFELQWLESRPDVSAVQDAHSLYIEVLSELGLVGLILLVAAIGTLLVGLARRARGQRRPLFAAIFTVSLMWAVHAGVDWDWELAAVSAWLFALAGIGLANTTRTRATEGGAAMWALRVGAGLLCLVVAVGALRMVVSTDSLARGISDFKAGNCAGASSRADTSLTAIDSQPQAAAIEGYCDALGGRERAAIGRMEEAIRLDAQHWRYWYGLGIVKAMGGKDPRADLARARRLNPLGQLFTERVPARLARAARPAQWRALARRAPRPID
ncbi:MAG TPA: O-antigen ligase family protein [Thermoleophilaceae bacterium]|nr:O-antigen ligase family protein [Thermoleophilaceae bacterium]